MKDKDKDTETREKAAPKDGGAREKARKTAFSELGYLLRHGVRIELTEKEYSRCFGRLRERVVSHVYEIQQPTLGTLDLINYLLRDVRVDEEAIANAENIYPVLRRVACDSLRPVSEAVAAAILGSRCYVKRGGIYREDWKEIDRVAGVLLRSMTPKKLLEAARAVAVMCNLSDFTNSIRLLQTAPDRIEPVDAG